ncbi:MFS transporter [Calothrix sp. 336/3]|uniref:MFS transporter n=1 Tax=Calothrix sp. 336/3 TaxID=1337936 RepID=UPI0004E2A059|nr:MFS transporter [Calothrix sp. 336/3]AKG23825.1 MFS transporter [Calothrix sp. 336/3]
MEQNSPTTPHQGILWLQVLGLAGVQGAITLSWLIYNLYLPLLLTEFGFPAGLTASILVLENALAIVLEPLMGGLSDRAKYWVGSSFPFVSVGVILSSALYIGIPAVTILLPGVDGIRLVLPIIVVAWAIAMTIFRSPAIALLGIYANRQDLPLAGSLLTLIAGIIGAMRPLSTGLILGMGAMFAFTIGSLVLLGAAAVLRFVNPPSTRVNQVIPLVVDWGQLIPGLFVIFTTGTSLAFASRFLMDALNKLLKIHLNNNSIDGLMVLISLALAFAAIPAGIIAQKIGNRLAMLIGIGVITVIMTLMLYLGAQMPIVLIGIFAFSLISNGAIPFALSMMPPRWIGLGIGMYFGGFSLTSSIFTAVFPKPQTIAPEFSIWAGAIAFIIAGICIGMSSSLSSESSS